MDEYPIIVSACLAGLATTHDGRAKPHPKVLELVRQGKAILVCPEQLGGLPTPRPEAEISADGRVLDINGVDVTENYLRGAREALKVARLAGSTKAILKARSPSCGSAEIYDGTFSGTMKQGEGVTAEALRQVGLEVVSEEDL